MAKRFGKWRGLVLGSVVGLLSSVPASAQVYNLKVVSDASPDYTDLDSLVHSTTSNWETDKDKMWALFYWNHIARRQTEPMYLHGKAETDPIRQFNDYGFTMCSTISGINMAIWQHMGYPGKYYDISLHTVPEVFYDNGWHHYDNSLSVIYTLCDGTTIAGIEDIGKTLACAASDGKEEPGHIAIYHSLNGTSVDGFLEGADTMRDLRHLGRDSFKPEYLKYRYYFNDAERGHRYILNLRDNEVYARHYARLDRPEGSAGGKFASDPAYFTPNGKNDDGTPRDPESTNPRYRIRGNGTRTWTPAPAADGVYKVEGANVITSLTITADTAGKIEVSTTNGMTWTTVNEAAGSNVNLKLINEVNGAYEVLVRAPGATNLKFQTITQVNSKTQPQLKLGKNTIYVGAGEQTESIVLWPELQSDRYLPYTTEAVNVRTDEKHEGWHGVLYAKEEGKEGYVVFKADAPQDVTRITQGARMYVRAPKAEIRFEHSFDGGKTWVPSFALNDTKQPWDDIHHQVTTDIPAGTKSVLFKYILKNASIYSLRMETNHKPAPGAAIKPVEVTFDWSERQEDYSLVKRSHTQLVEKLPATYTINVGGADHPIVDALTVNLKGARPDVKYGYSDGTDVGGEKFVGNWVTYGKNLTKGKPYTCTVPSVDQWEAAPADTILTDGIVGPPYTGGTAYRTGVLWKQGTTPEVTIDLGAPTTFSAFRIQLGGYEAKDAVKGQIKDKVEVFTSNDGTEFTSHGFFDFNLRWKDVPVNYMWTDEETFCAHNFTKLLPGPATARYVKFKVTPTRFVSISEMQVVDTVTSKPFDLKVALPKEK